MNDNIEISQMMLHYVGNRTVDEGVFISDHPIKVSEKVLPFLKYFFLSPFKLEELCNFYHESKINKNKVYAYSSQIFEHPKSFGDVSAKIANHLYERSNHPKIKGGDFFTVLFRNVEVDRQLVDAIGLFKAENKENYIRISRSGESVMVDSERGVNIQKLDKGCLIFNIEKDNGYVVAVVDKTTRGAEAKYWVDDFLHVVPRDDNYNRTKNAVNLCKSYISSLASKIDKSQRALMLNKVAEMLKSGSFDLRQLNEDVLADDKLVDGFAEYKQQYEENVHNKVSNLFSTEPSALKRLSFGNLTNIRLDNNFGISIRGGENLLEKGYDHERGMKYYKLYYREEK